MDSNQGRELMRPTNMVAVLGAFPSVLERRLCSAAGLSSA